MSRRLRVAVIAGGRSSEHEISLASARSVLAALDPERYEVTTVAIERSGRWAIAGEDSAALGGESVVPTQSPVESLPVLESPTERHVVGYLSEQYALRRYNQELERRRSADLGERDLFSMGERPR